MRPRGLPVLLLLVALGIGVGAGFFRWKQPRIAAEFRRQIAAAPATPEGRLERWLEYGSAQIHHRLAVVGRASEQSPWLVTHVLVEPDGDREAWGIDVSELPRDLARREGLAVVVELPPPRALGPSRLPPEAARHVPHLLRTDAVPPDGGARLVELADWLLHELADALAEDVPGARIEVRVASTGDGATAAREERTAAAR